MELEKPPGIQMIPVIALERDIATARLQSVIGNSRETKGEGISVRFTGEQ